MKEKGKCTDLLPGYLEAHPASTGSRFQSIMSEGALLETSQRRASIEYCCMGATAKLEALPWDGVGDGVDAFKLPRRPRWTGLGKCLTACFRLPPLGMLPFGRSRAKARDASYRVIHLDLRPFHAESRASWKHSYAGSCLFAAIGTPHALHAHAGLEWNSM